MKDLELAEKYLLKAERCRKSKTVFTLSFAQFKRLMTTLKCRYTGVNLVHKTTVANNPRYITLDRVDNSKGYVTGNVVACCFAYNNFKAVMENPSSIITMDLVEKAIKVQRKLESKK